MYGLMCLAFGLSSAAAMFATIGVIVCVVAKATPELVAETQRWIMIMGFFFWLGLNLGDFL